MYQQLKAAIDSIEPVQLKALHTLLSKTNMIPFTADIIGDVTYGKSTSSKDLTWEEAETLVK